MATKAFVSSDVTFVPNNYEAPLNTTNSPAAYHQIQSFLAHSDVATTLTAPPTLYGSQINAFWETGIFDDGEDSGSPSITFTVNDVERLVTLTTVRTALGFPAHTSYTTAVGDSELVTMMEAIGYDGPLDKLGQLKRPYLRKEWSFFFDCITRAFEKKCTNWDAIPKPSLQIGYSILYGSQFDYARHVLLNIGAKMDEDRTTVYFARFVQLLFNVACPGVDTTNAVVMQPFKLHKRVFQDLIKKDGNKDAVPELFFPPRLSVFVTGNQPMPPVNAEGSSSVRPSKTKKRAIKAKQQQVQVEVSNSDDDQPISVVQKKRKAKSDQHVTDVSTSTPSKRVKKRAMRPATPSDNEDDFPCVEEEPVKQKKRRRLVKKYTEAEVIDFTVESTQMPETTHSEIPVAEPMVQADLEALRVTKPIISDAQAPTVGETLIHEPVISDIPQTADVGENLRTEPATEAETLISKLVSDLVETALIQTDITAPQVINTCLEMILFDGEPHTENSIHSETVAVNSDNAPSVDEVISVHDQEVDVQPLNTDMPHEETRVEATYENPDAVWDYILAEFPDAFITNADVDEQPIASHTQPISEAHLDEDAGDTVDQPITKVNSELLVDTVVQGHANAETIPSLVVHPEAVVHTEVFTDAPETVPPTTNADMEDQAAESNSETTGESNSVHSTREPTCSYYGYYQGGGFVSQSRINPVNAITSQLDKNWITDTFTSAQAADHLKTTATSIANPELLNHLQASVMQIRYLSGKFDEQSKEIIHLRDDIHKRETGMERLDAVEGNQAVMNGKLDDITKSLALLTSILLPPDVKKGDKITQVKSISLPQRGVPFNTNYECSGSGKNAILAPPANAIISDEVFTDEPRNDEELAKKLFLEVNPEAKLDDVIAEENELKKEHQKKGRKKAKKSPTKQKKSLPGIKISEAANSEQSLQDKQKLGEEASRRGKEIEIEASSKKKKKFSPTNIAHGDTGKPTADNAQVGRTTKGTISDNAQIVQVPTSMPPQQSLNSDDLKKTFIK
ncbi:hypothetical protein OROHE_025413 [Orobanche hederae]